MAFLPFVVRATLSERFASYYGNLRSLLLGSNLTGRRATFQEDSFAEEASLTAFRKEKEKDGELSLRFNFVYFTSSI